MDSDIDRLVWPKDGNTFQWIDRAKKILDVVTRAGVAYAGLNAFKHPMGAVYALLGLRLAESAGALPSNLVGVGMLAHIGATNMQIAGGEYTPTEAENEKFLATMGKGHIQIGPYI